MRGSFRKSRALGSPLDAAQASATAEASVAAASPARTPSIIPSAAIGTTAKSMIPSTSENSEPEDADSEQEQRGGRERNDGAGCRPPWRHHGP